MSAPWPMVPLGEVLRLVERTVQVEPGTAYRTIGVKWWGEGAYERETIDGADTAAKTLSIVREGDLIINKIWVRHGSVAVATRAVDGCAASGEFPTFDADKARVGPAWLHWLSKSRSFWYECEQLSQGTSGKNRIKPERFVTIPIPLPPVAEQRRIVGRIEAVASRIEEAKRLREEATTEAGAMRDSVANNLIDPTRFHLVPSFRLEDLAEIRSGVTLGRELTGELVELPYLRVANVQDGCFDLGTIKRVSVLASEQGKWLLQRGDILVTEGGDWDKLGRGGVWDGQIPNCIHQNHIFRIRMHAPQADPNYVAAVISSPYGKAYFRSVAKQTTNLASISQKQLKALVVPVPPLEDQRAVLASLARIEALQQQAQTLQASTAADLDALLPAVLAEAFAGRF